MFLLPFQIPLQFFLSNLSIRRSCIKTLLVKLPDLKKVLNIEAPFKLALILVGINIHCLDDVSLFLFLF